MFKILRRLELLVRLDLGFFGLLLRNLGTNVELVHNPVPGCLGIVSELSKDGSSRRGSAVLEVRVLSAGKGAELVEAGSLGNGLEK